ncbi:MAG: ABC transporter permease [Bacteroidetes bacterium]|nr:ABC transporter permease [Bacteroidota bacterium]
MMGKIGLIISREYITKARSRAFILLTLLGPLMYGLLIGVSTFLASQDSEKDLRVDVVDETGQFENKIQLEDNTVFNFLPEMTQTEFENTLALIESGSVGLFIPKNALENPKGIRMYFSEHPGSSFINRVEEQIENYISEQRMKEVEVDKKVLNYINVHVKIDELKMGEDGAKESSAAAAITVSYLTGFLLYFFIFIYGSLVLRGVQEEKTSRIVEVIISSARPFELMMGKIIGNALLGLTQFAIWIGLGALMIGGIVLFGPEIQAPGDMTMTQGDMNLGFAYVLKGWDALQTLPLAQTLIYFILFFLGGYFLYSSLFAAVAAAVDSQQDMQQFMLPISIPLVIAVMVLSSVVQDPNGSTAVIFSMIPFTSPIIMMARIPFGVEWWEPLLSFGILAASFVICVMVAAKIYRIGLLIYGTKPTWKQLAKWIISK